MPPYPLPAVLVVNDSPCLMALDVCHPHCGAGVNTEHIKMIANDDLHRQQNVPIEEISGRDKRRREKTMGREVKRRLFWFNEGRQNDSADKQPVTEVNWVDEL